MGRSHYAIGDASWRRGHSQDMKYGQQSAMLCTEGKAYVSTARGAGERGEAAQEVTQGHFILLYFSLRSPYNKFSKPTNQPTNQLVAV